MKTAVALIRGINVGGNRTIRMDALRGIFADLGYADARTYIQSGNVIFRAAARDLTGLPSRVEAAIEKSHAFRPTVVVRSAPHLEDAAAKRPFGDPAGLDESRLLVMFLAAPAAKNAPAALAAACRGPERVHLDGRELFVHYPAGVGKSKLTPRADPRRRPHRAQLAHAARAHRDVPRASRTGLTRPRALLHLHRRQL
jgi:uncharacterized protein (DUF1697 family)